LRSSGGGYWAGGRGGRRPIQMFIIVVLHVVRLIPRAHQVTEIEEKLKATERLYRYSMAETEVWRCWRWRM